MMKEIKVSYEIEKFDENLINLMKMLGTFKLIDKVQHPRPIWSIDDEYYFDRYTYTYTWTVTGNVEMAENLYQLAVNNDLLN